MVLVIHPAVKEKSETLPENAQNVMKIFICGIANETGGRTGGENYGGK